MIDAFGEQIEQGDMVLYAFTTKSDGGHKPRTKLFKAEVLTVATGYIVVGGYAGDDVHLIKESDRVYLLEESTK